MEAGNQSCDSIKETNIQPVSHPLLQDDFILVYIVDDFISVVMGKH